MNDTWRLAYAKYMLPDDPAAVRLNLGCGSNKEEGWINIDCDSRVQPDLLVDLEPSSFSPNLSEFPALYGRVDVILASHILEHIRDIVPLFGIFWQLLKPGGHLIAVTPYASSDDAIADPRHVRYFTEETWHYFCDQLYRRPGHAGSGGWQGMTYYPWQVVEVRLVPYPQFQSDPQIEFHKRFWRNIIREMHAVMRKPSEDEVVQSIPEEIELKEAAKEEELSIEKETIQWR